ncbi:hypothetical protein Tco_0411738 [Tanacetum coccineum]
MCTQIVTTTRPANVVEPVGATGIDSNHIGTLVSTQRKRTRQDSQVGSSSCEAGPSKRARHPTATARRVSGRANRRPPTVSCASTEGCNSGHRQGEYLIYALV